MRTEADQEELRKWLNEIGDASTGSWIKQGRNYVNKLEVKPANIVHTLEEAINFCFPPGLFVDPLNNADYAAKNAILCPTNNEVSHINDLAIEKMYGTLREIVSFNEPLEPADNYHGFRSDFNMEAIENETPSGMPPHILKLKVSFPFLLTFCLLFQVGAPVMLIRNLDLSQGLCNGTRMQVLKITDNMLICRILSGPRADSKQTYMIPRVKFEYGHAAHHRGLRFRRIQFPIRPCFAMTINKVTDLLITLSNAFQSQGQTLKKMALVLNRKQCFSHGQVYVAMSRVTSIDGIRVFSPQTCKGDTNYIHNVVWHELHDGAAIPRIVDEPEPNRRLEFPEADSDEDVYFD